MPFDPALIPGGALAALLLAVAPAGAAGVAGDFDFYVLSLSWSPTHCSTDADPDPAQCGVTGRGFVVHGLWPEYESGFPEFCRSATPSDLGEATIESIGDIMPSASLARHQWRKHGVCSGLDADDYFDLLRRATESVAIPDALADGDPPARPSPQEIESAFAAANPGLSSGGMSVQCRGGIFTEIRLCMTKALAFRQCLAVDADSCRSRAIVIPPGD